MPYRLTKQPINYVNQSHIAQSWCMVADFKLLRAVIHKKWDGWASNFARP